MRECEDFRNRFFTFFNGIIYHELPNLDIDTEQHDEPRVEMPPHPPISEDPELGAISLEEWKILFQYEHKRIGERLQRHKCKPTALKIRPIPLYESDVNGHNPILLVYTRHNHDLKWILSGKAAKAAMFYISDYVTKMPLKTDQLLSLLSKAVASIDMNDMIDTPIGKAKKLIHRCLTHFGRAQQLHAQSAARYLRQLGDSMSSHRTINMMPSANLIMFVRNQYSPLLSSNIAEVDEDISIRLTFTKTGQIQESSEIENYWFRPQSLDHYSFYDFFLHFTCEPRSRSTTQHTSETSNGVLTRYALLLWHRITEYASLSPEIPHITPQMESQWKAEIKSQSDAISRVRRGLRNYTQEPQPVLTHINSLSTSSAWTCDQPNPSSSTNTNPVSPPMSVSDVMNTVATTVQLNQKQQEAFQIIASTFVEQHVISECSSAADHEPLRMFLTGPGGTGKTHVVKAVKEVMKHYGVENTIRFVAPTGTAANLIDGTTIHKGLGISIRRGKVNDGTGDMFSKVSFSMSNKTKVQLCEEWKDVLVLMVDEVSLISLSLLAEIDAALRFVKESPDKFFGGVNMIFSGDLYQYPPSPGRPLYYPLTYLAKRTDGETMNRLGRLAWKSVNSVISLTEQKRMNSDPEYAAAVNRLRTRECIEDDVQLFNTRVIKSSYKPDGIAMSADDDYLCSMILKTNKHRQHLNRWKSEAVCSGTSSPTLYMCAAIDKITFDSDKTQQDVQNLPLNVRQELLDLDTSSSKLQKSLIGWLPLYIGMPAAVVLRERNLSTELGITNGARGYIRSVDLSVDTNNISYATGAIVEFPGSEASLKGLPIENRIIE
ncbi:hypothetical protein D9757_011692 [Collybiopsis confluens]|uniref:ATP-dependent DNA helicase n=1 Tax=Collybiopsis confluens TaxID=2823264 RepID=A0A8H5LRV4_9AGAR|nr:hypothetical protein D9757_011692 [Collybiopsis confluens]